MIVKTPNRFVIALDRRYLLLLRTILGIKQKITGENYPSSYPYISVDSFRVIANHQIDTETDLQRFDPKSVALGDIVFINNNFVERYLREKNKDIQNKYILFGFNDDTNIDEKIASLLDDRIAMMYAQDDFYEHPKIMPVPFGLECLRFKAAGILSIYSSLQKRLERKIFTRKNRIFFKFNLRTNPIERGEASSYLSKHPLADTTEDKLSPRLHAKLLSSYKFVASPPGHTIESSRTWEALYLKTIPIVKDSAAMRYFVSLGLPLWVIKDWRELDGLTEKVLEIKYEKIMNEAKWNALHMDFWLSIILKKQKEIRNL